MFHLFTSDHHRDRGSPKDHGRGAARERRFAHADESWGRGGRHRHRHEGRSGRMFDHGQLRLVILRLIADKPSYGYELIKDIEERLGGGYSPSPGVIYPALTLLEEMGHAAVASSEGARKLYAATDAGKAFLDASKPQIDAIFARMNAAGKSRASSQAPQILRAMENLKTALRLRLSQGVLADSEIMAIAAALDRAALDVESVQTSPQTGTQIEEGN